nr:hypothetical protein BaRGS_004263 [Batillaria attramentaria]
MALDWTHPQDAPNRTSPGGSSLDSRWTKSQRKTQGDVAADSGQGAEGKQTDLGDAGEESSEQAGGQWTRN